MKLLLNLDLSLRAALDLRDLRPNVYARVGNLDLSERAHLKPLKLFACEPRTFRKELLVFVDEVFGEPLAFEQLEYALVALVFENALFVFQVLFELLFFGPLDRKRPLIFLSALSREDLHVNDDAVDARRTSQARVANVACLLAEDGAKQFLFSRKLSLTLRRDLAHDNRAGL